MLKALRVAFPRDWRQFSYLNYRKSLLVSCFCSGLVYRAFSCLHQKNQEFLFLPKQLQTNIRPFEVGSTFRNLAVLFADENQSNKTSNDDSKRIDKLSLIQRWVEEELPSIFSRGIFETTTDVFGQETSLEIERLNGPPILLRGKSKANFFLALVRSYFQATSTDRRIDILAIHTDQEEWNLEVNFRVVLLPGATSGEAVLPINQQLQRLEQRAKYHDFRAIFYISKSGSLTLVKITKLTPPQQPPLRLALPKIRFIGLLAPVLPGGGRRLPQPSELTFLDHMSYSSSNFPSNTSISCPERRVSHLLDFPEDSQHEMSLLLSQSRNFSNLRQKFQFPSSALLDRNAASSPGIRSQSSYYFSYLFIVIQKSVDYNQLCVEDPTHKLPVKSSAVRYEFTTQKSNQSIFDSHAFILEAFRTISQPLI